MRFIRICALTAVNVSLGASHLFIDVFTVGGICFVVQFDAEMPRGYCRVRLSTSGKVPEKHRWGNCLYLTRLWCKHLKRGTGDGGRWTGDGGRFNNNLFIFFSFFMVSLFFFSFNHFSCVIPLIDLPSYSPFFFYIFYFFLLEMCCLKMKAPKSRNVSYESTKHMGEY